MHMLLWLQIVCICSSDIAFGSSPLFCVFFYVCRIVGKNRQPHPLSLRCAFLRLFTIVLPSACKQLYSLCPCIDVCTQVYFPRSYLDVFSDAAQMSTVPNNGWRPCVQSQSSQRPEGGLQHNLILSLSFHRDKKESERDRARERERQTVTKRKTHRGRR